jgi:hypothetical protein
VANQVESLGSPVESLGSPVEPLANPVDSPANVIEPSANQVPPSAKHVQPPANEGGAAAFSVEQLKQAMRRVRLPAGMSMVQLSDRLYGDSRYAMALLQLNHRRADDRGQFIPGTQIMYLPAEMLEYVYPDLIPAPSVEGDRSTSAIRPVDYREPLGERGSEADRREPPRRESIQGGGTATDWYVTRGGESLFQIAADSFDQASFYLQLWEWNRSQLEGRYRPTDPLPQGLRLRVAPPR